MVSRIELFRAFGCAIDELFLITSSVETIRQSGVQCRSIVLIRCASKDSLCAKQRHRRPTNLANASACSATHEQHAFQQRFIQPGKNDSHATCNLLHKGDVK